MMFKLASIVILMACAHAVPLEERASDVCSSGIYKDLNPLKNYPIAVAFCQAKFPPACEDKANKEKGKNKRTSPAPATTPLALIWVKATIQPYSTLSTLCSCIQSHVDCPTSKTTSTSKSTTTSSTIKTTSSPVVTSTSGVSTPSSTAASTTTLAPVITTTSEATTTVQTTPTTTSTSTTSVDTCLPAPTCNPGLQCDAQGFPFQIYCGESIATAPNPLPAVPAVDPVDCNRICDLDEFCGAWSFTSSCTGTGSCTVYYGYSPGSATTKNDPQGSWGYYVADAAAANSVCG